VGAAWKAYALRKYAIIDPLPIAAFITYPEGEGKRAVLHGLLKTYTYRSRKSRASSAAGADNRRRIVNKRLGAVVIVNKRP